jgi:hypothetical protein
MNGLEILALFGAGGMLSIAGVLAARHRAHRTWQQELVTYVLRFPRGLDPSAVVVFLSGL